MTTYAYPVLFFIYTGLCAQKSWHYWSTFSYAEAQTLSVVYFIIMPLIIGVEIRHLFKSRIHWT